VSRNFVVGVDCSTTSAKALVVDEQGTVVASGRASLTVESGSPGQYEQDGCAWWAAVGSALRSALSFLGDDDRRRLDGLCIANQRESFVLVDREGIPLAPAILWLDSRGRRYSDRHRESDLERLTGRPPSPTTGLFKLMWLRDESPELFAATSTVLDVQGFLMHSLTGERATSVATGESLGLVDFDSGGWSDEILDLLDLPIGKLPRLCAPGEAVGRVTSAAARTCGLPEGLPVLAGAGDGQAGLLGSGSVAKGQVCVSFGTSLACGVLVTERHHGPGLRNLLGPLPGYSVVESLLRTGALTQDWLCRLLGDEGSPLSIEQLHHLARRAPAGADGVLFVPYLEGADTPSWDADARALLVGLKGGHGREVVARSVLEGIAYELRLHISLIEEAIGCTIGRVTGIGGGFRGDLGSSIVCDIVGRPIQLMPTVEATARGAGIIAAAGVGWGEGSNVGERGVFLATSLAPAIHEIQPSDEHGSRYERLFDVYRRLHPSLAWVGPAIERIDSDRGPPGRKEPCDRGPEG
jgi:xylulokinase